MSDGKRRYDNIIRAVYAKPWAILPSMLAVIEEIVELRASGAPLSPEQIQARVGAASNGPRNGSQGGSVAVIPIYGVLTKRAGLMSEMSGATSLEQLTADFRGALADPEVGAIVFDVDSPGGSVDGVTEMAAEIRAARGQKPMLAVANTSMASAAYWLASQADQLIATPSAAVGSIGIIGMHVDISKAEEMAGETVTLITAGAGKADGNEHQPLSDSARTEMQAMADDYYGLFVSDVAAGRGVKAKVITDTWQAQVFTARKAKAAGLVDRIDTLEATVSRMLAKVNRGGASVDHGGIPAASMLGASFDAVAIRPHTTATSEDAWDGPANEKRLPSERGPLRASHAWVDDNADPDLKASYKFIHHFVSDSGVVTAASTAACSMGISVLNGGRTGTTIPVADREGVHAHLGGHLRDAGRDVPPLRGEAPEMAIAALLATMPVHEQLAVVSAEARRVTAHYAKKADLRAKEGRVLPESVEQQLAALSMDLDTDQPEEAAPTRKGWRNRTQLALSEAAFASGYPLSE